MLRDTKNSNRNRRKRMLECIQIAETTSNEVKQNKAEQKKNISKIKKETCINCFEDVLKSVKVTACIHTYKYMSVYNINNNNNNNDEIARNSHIATTTATIKHTALNNQKRTIFLLCDTYAYVCMYIHVYVYVHVPQCAAALFSNIHTYIHLCISNFFLI